jgi:glutamyl-Q tRNA(Asp) synthetase
LSYIGRFAPSPTGPLHFGSLVSALASFLDARHHRGKWLVRIEDLDPPRTRPGSDTLILATLEQFGLTWDESILYQSQRLGAYEQALQQLNESGLLFPCRCTRQESKGTYQGKCRARQFNLTAKPYAIRVRVEEDAEITFEDRVWGHQVERLHLTCGDFIVKRKDSLIAYQLAVTVDDHFQNITHVFRGADLLGSTFRQIYLQQFLGFTTPQYGHTTLVTDSAGLKLSKQTRSTALDVKSTGRTLVAALDVLQQDPPAELALLPASEIVTWAIAHWQPEHISTRSIAVDQVLQVPE